MPYNIPALYGTCLDSDNISYITTFYNPLFFAAANFRRKMTSSLALFRVLQTIGVIGSIISCRIKAINFGGPQI